MKTLAQTNVLTLANFQESLHLVHPDVKKKLLDLLRFGPIVFHDEAVAGDRRRFSNTVSLPNGKRIHIEAMTAKYALGGKGFLIGEENDYLPIPVMYAYVAAYASMRGWKNASFGLDFYQSSYLVGNIPMMKNHLELDHPLPTLFY